MTEPMQHWAPPEGPAATPPAPEAPTPVAQPLVAPKKQSGRMTNVILVVAAIIAIGGVAFAIGRSTAPAAASTGGRFANGQGFAGGPNGSFNPANGPGGAFGSRTVTITGTVKSFDGSTLVLTTANGTETTVNVAGSTYHAQAAATSSDVKAGATVQVSVEGFGGFRGGAAASAAPGASGAPTTGTITATDVLVKSGQ